MASTLLELSNLISSSIATVDARCKALSRTYPDLDNPANAPEDENVVHDAEIAEAASIAIAAASQLIANLNSPARTMLETSLMCLVSAALGVVSASATAEIVREAGPQGAHINDIAKKNGMDPMKIARVLRPLATQHIFREVAPDVFAHNRISTTLDTGKSPEDILAAPENKHQNEQGYAAIIELNTDETFKAGAYIRDVVFSSRRNNTEEQHDELDTPLNRAFSTHTNLFSWYEQPENRVRFRRFGMAMDAARRVNPPDTRSQRYPWATLPEGTIVADIGAGIGSVSMVVAKANPKVKILIQDKAAVIEEAKEFWEKELPGSSADGRVTFQEHDFFGPQPAKEADIFLLCRICHDWSDSYVLRILKHLRQAAKPTARLLIQERIIPFVCGEDNSLHHVPGAMLSTTPPKPLLANGGRIVSYLIDMQMMALLSGSERTLPHYWKLAKAAGWEIERVYREGADPMNQMVLRPV
ncbi:S-adenosyl-L-methionine-dependent methyltransferase [Favolaschia claudopus]|uniref:S-adenosyl-L-methionine-dependent methyltransferase n=1 Tax=Favolaschia claudopus TaxID=2862362 RepID=A0AAW0DX51_9AGAR